MTGVMALALVASLTTAVATAPSDSQIKADVQQRLKGLDLGRPGLTVDVQDGVVTLSGSVPTLWVKEEAVNRARKVSNVQSLVADLTIPKAENDLALAREVSDRIRHYDLYTVYDTVDGSVRNGRVRLTGAVTEPKKAADVFERIAKVRGVQAIDNQLEVLPSSQSDDRLRVTIANAIYRDEAFVNYSMVDPPIHVIVNRGHVTLIGVVRADLERFKAESIARMVFGVLALDDKVQIAGARK